MKKCKQKNIIQILQINCFINNLYNKYNEYMIYVSPIMLHK